MLGLGDSSLIHRSIIAIPSEVPLRQQTYNPIKCGQTDRNIKTLVAIVTVCLFVCVCVFCTSMRHFEEEDIL